MKRYPAILLALSAISGVVIRDFPFFGVLLFLGIIAFFYVLYRRPIFLIVGFLMGIAALSAVNLSLHLQRYQEIVSSLTAEPVLFGTIDDVRSTEGATKIVFMSSHQRNVKLFLKDAACALPLKIGQQIGIKTTLYPLDPPLSLVHFDALSYGLSHGIHAQAFIKDPEKILLGETKNYRLASLRYHLRNSIIKHLTPHQSSLLLALIFGETDLFSKTQKQIYQELGIQHLLAVSGLQVTLLGGLVFFILFHLFSLLPIVSATSRLRMCGFFSIIFIWFFVILCHAPGSAIRAGLMTSIAMFPVISGRKISWLTIISTSIFLTLLWDPLSSKDIGCLLSYSATFGIILALRFISKPLEKIYRCSRLLWLLCAWTCTSISAFLATLPIISFYFSTWAPSSVLANILLVPLASLLQLPSIVFGLLGALFDSSFLLNIAAFCSSLIEINSELLHQFFGGIYYFSASNIALTSFSIAMLFIVFLALLRRRFITALASFLIASLCYFWPYFSHVEGLIVHVLPVGQGDASLIEMPNGQTMLIDAGGQSYGQFDPGAEIVLPLLKRLNINQLDVVAISHPDPDHINGIFALFDKIIIKEIWHSGFSQDHPLTVRLLHEAQKRKIPVKNTLNILGAHDFGATRIEVLGPNTKTDFPYFKEFKTNDNSLVIAIEYQQKRLLWPGDIEKKAEYMLLSQHAPLKADVIKAPHHGSRTSSTQGFIDQVAADYVIFSTGKNNRFSFPHDEVVERYVKGYTKVFDTAIDGHIMISVDKKGIDIAAFSSACHKDPRRSCPRKG